jgi:hypothetical protein
MGPHRVAEWMPYYLADLFASVLPRVRGPSVFFCHIPWRQAHSGYIGRKWAKRPRHVMWQNRLHPCAVFTETSGGFAPHYLAQIRHDLRQTTLRAISKAVGRSPACACAVAMVLKVSAYHVSLSILRAIFKAVGRSPAWPSSRNRQIFYG